MLLKEGEKLDLYTVEFQSEDEATTSLFGEYLKELDASGLRKDAMVMKAWLTNIGRYGLKNLELRDEQAALAIPPARISGHLASGNNAKSLIEAFKGLPAPRLYLANYGDALILLGGGLKTTRRAQDCTNVGPDFELANRICRTFDKLLEEGDIKIDNYGELIIPEGLEFDIGP